MNINSQIVESITVYDHNIPADFGDFSGGVVDAETISPFSTDTRVSFGIRGNRSDWGEYHIIDNDEPDDTAEGKDDLEPPIYEKTNIDFSIQKKLNEQHALLMSVSYLKSDISDISLSAQKVESRENINALLKDTAIAMAGLIHLI